MPSIFPFFPERASTVAGDVDALYIFLIALSVFFGLLIAGLVTVFAVRFKRRSDADRPAAIHGSLPLELAWTGIPLALVAVIFFWSADIYFRLTRVPHNAVEVKVVGKRWMWKLQHLTGQREINELHVPVGVPIKLTLTSEDVIHSFYVPAFRIKKDAVPGRYNTAWFQATQPGRYHLFCAEYCGTKHSTMIGSIVVMEPAAFQAWLAGGAQGQPLHTAGEKLFRDLACITCHRGDSGARGPDLTGLFGSTVKLAGGGTLVADETYVRESIVAPAARIVEGYQPIMPTFQGLVSEEQLLQLVAYIQSLKAPGAQPATAPAAAPSLAPAAPSKDARKP
jgi:cytochrome c oxidase subunit 2